MKMARSVRHTPDRPVEWQDQDLSPVRFSPLNADELELALFMARCRGVEKTL